MLIPETPYPHVGSYALFIDLDAAAPQAAELVRIQWRREHEVVVSFPLRDGAGGNKRIDPALLIDASPLSAQEEREYHELDRALFGRTRFTTPKQKRDKARRDALKQRIIYGPVLDRLLRFARSHQRSIDKAA